MKIRLLKVLFAAAFLFCCLAPKNSFGQSASFAALSGGLASSPITSGQTQVPLIGFSVAVSGGSITFNQYNISWTNSSTSQSHLANGTLYRSTSSTFSSSSPGTPVGNVTFNGSNITVNNFNETVTNTTYYYFLVADIVYSSGSIDYNGQIYINSASFASDVNGNTYSAYLSYINYQFNSGSTPYPVSVANTTTGLTSSSTTLVSGNTALPLFGFSITTSGSYTFNKININSNLSNLSSYFTNFKLYVNTSNTYTGSTQVSGTSVNVSGSYIKFTSVGQSVNSTTKYYFLVADCSVSGTIPATVQFNFNDGQSSVALTSNSPSGTYNDFTVFGNTYNINTANVSITSQQNGLTASPVYGGETNAAVFGFGITVSGSTNISQININSNNSSLSTYFGSGTLYRSTTNNYSTGSLTAVGTVSFSGNYVNVTGLSESISNATNYYFLVLNDVYSGTSTSSVAFSFSNGQSSNALVQSSPSSYYNNFSVTGNTYSLTAAPTPTITATYISSGLSSTTVYYGNTVGVFGFSVNVTGASVTLSQFNLNADSYTNSLSTLFGTTAVLYRSTSSSYNSSSPGTAVGTVSFSGGNVTVSGLSEAFTSGQTNYYYLVVTDQWNSTTTSDHARFYMNSGSAITDSYGRNYAEYLTYGSTYTLSTPAMPTITATYISSGLSSTTVYYGQTVGVFGFSVNVSGASITLGQFNLNASDNTNSLSTLFGTSAVLYRSSSSSYNPSSPGTAVGTVSFSGSNVTVSGLSEAFISGQTNYYYLVVTDEYNTITTSDKARFYMNSGSAIQDSYSRSYAEYLTYGSDYVLNPPPTPTISISYNSSGLTSSTPPLYYGETGAALFGFSVTVSTNSVTLSQFNISTDQNSSTLSTLFGTSATLYRGTSSTYDPSNPGTAVGTVTFSGTTTVTISGLSEAFTVGQTNYYYLVLNELYTGDSDDKIRFYINSATAVLDSYSRSYSSYGSYGSIYQIGVTYDWKGSTSTDFTVGSNYVDLNGNAMSSGPSKYDQVRIGVINYTGSQPATTTTAIVDKLVFGPYGSPVLTLKNNKTFTINDGLVLNANANPTIASASATSLATLSVSGTSDFAPTSNLTLSNKITVSNSGTLTLQSDANNSASIAALPTTASITGTINVQRYLTGGSSTNYRSYRLLSSPVNYDGSNISLSYINTNTSDGSTTNYGALTAGPGGSVNGFTIANIYPTIYLYDEALPSSASFTGGKDVGVGVVTSSTITTVAGGLSATTTGIPIGNGYFLYFIGNNQSTNTASTRVPENTTITASGTLNQGTISFKLWSTGSTSLSYANPDVSGTKGYNLVGNPYPSTIDLNQLYADNSSQGYTTFYILSDVNPGQTYSTYNGNGLGNSASSPRYIASGQGFFVLATATGKTLTFKEDQKVYNTSVLTSTSSPPGVLSAPKSNKVTDNLSAPAAINTDAIAQSGSAYSGLHLMLQKDTLTYNSCGIYFNRKWSDSTDNNDGPILAGFSPTVYMSSYTANGLNTAINAMGDYTKGKRVKLYVKATSDGLYYLKMTDMQNIDTADFNIFLVDNYKKDSLDMVRYKSYAFNIINADTSSFGANRFMLAVERKPLPPYQLINFTAQKVTGGVQVNWKTYNEGDYTGFVLQKQNTSGQFTQLDSLQSNGSNNYSYTDPDPVTGANVYRLKQNDINGSITYSSPVTVLYDALTASGVFTVYPNPSRQLITVNVNSTDTNVPSYVSSIYNTSGDLITQKAVNTYNWTEDLSNYKAGVYIIVLKDSNGNLVGKTKFVKTN